MSAAWKKRSVGITPTEDGRATAVYVDGDDLASLTRRAVLTVLPAGEVTLSLELCKIAPSVDTQATVVVGPETTALLRSLGWTPPEDGPAEFQDEEDDDS